MASPNVGCFLRLKVDLKIHYMVIVTWAGLLKKIKVNSLYLQFDTWMLSKEQRKLSEKMIYRIKYIYYM